MIRFSVKGKKRKEGKKLSSPSYYHHLYVITIITITTITIILSSPSSPSPFIHNLLHHIYLTIQTKPYYHYHHYYDYNYYYHYTLNLSIYLSIYLFFSPSSHTLSHHKVLDCTKVILSNNAQPLSS